MKKIILATVVILLTSGCVTKRYYPTPINEDTAKLKSIMSGSSSGIIQGLDPATSESDAIKQINAYAVWYLHMSSRYKQDEYKHDDASLGFGLAGLVAGVLESPEGAALGALLASGAELPISRYHLAVQSANYEKASDTMHCVYRYLLPLELDPAKKLHIPDLDFLNDKIYEVRRKLRKAQNQISLAAPDQEELKNKLSEIINQKPKVDQTETEVAKELNKLSSADKATASGLGFLSIMALPAAAPVLDNYIKAKLEAILAARKQTKNQIEACVASFSD